MLNSQDKAIARLRNSGIVDFDQEERPLFHIHEERAKSDLMTPSRCECPHSTSLQERSFQLFHLDTSAAVANQALSLDFSLGDSTVTACIRSITPPMISDIFWPERVATVGDCAGESEHNRIGKFIYYQIVCGGHHHDC